MQVAHRENEVVHWGPGEGRGGRGVGRLGSFAQKCLKRHRPVLQSSLLCFPSEALQERYTDALLLEIRELFSVTAALSNDRAPPLFAAVLLLYHELSILHSLILHNHSSGSKFVWENGFSAVALYLLELLHKLMVYHVYSTVSTHENEYFQVYDMFLPE